jgi:hypothetical protein
MATVGQASLLVNKRFKQYDELCDLSEDTTAELSAGATDLEGFWEVICMQVKYMLVIRNALFSRRWRSL